MSERDYLWAGMILCTFIVAFFVGMGAGTFQERYRKCPPPPEIKICRLELPERKSDPLAAVPVGRMPR